MRTRTALLLAVLLLADPAPAQSLDGLSSDTHHAVNNYQNELMDCAAYFSISAQGMKVDDPELAERYTRIAEQATTLAFGLGQQLGMSEQAMLARARLSLRALLDQMDRDYVNYSVLLERYAEPCSEALQDPKQRLRHWLAQ